jgi:uncharacterized protein (UPF0218 family)
MQFSYVGDVCTQERLSECIHREMNALDNQHKRKEAIIVIVTF